MARTGGLRRVDRELEEWNPNGRRQNSRSAEFCFNCDRGRDEIRSRETSTRKGLAWQNAIIGMAAL